MIRRTEPTRTLLQGGAYLPSWNTDIRKTFEKARNAASAADFGEVYRFLLQFYSRPDALQHALAITRNNPTQQETVWTTN